MPFLKPPIPDATLDPFDGGVGVLTSGGEVVGHVATTLSRMWSPSSPLRWQWWVWYIVVWADGTRERSAEDYPPFLAVNEMKSGCLELVATSHDGRYDFAWLSPDDAAATRDRLGIADRDF